MPITSLICPCTSGALPLDHFSSGACKGWRAGQLVPAAWAASIVKNRLDDRYHADGRLTVTRALTCPRETLIQDFKSVTFDVRDENNLYWGTVIHAALEQGSTSVNSQLVEIRFGGPGDKLPSARLFVGPELFGEGIEFCGKADHVTMGWGAIHDYKCHSETTQRFKSGKVDISTAVQMNLYRLSLMQVIPEAAGKLDELIAYHCAMTSASGPAPWITEVQPLMTEEQILAAKPNGGDATVRDIITAYLKFKLRRDAHMPLDENLKLVPLYGRTMFRQIKCTKYCASGVRGVCDQLEGIQNFSDF